ncbi:MAG: hemerythrin family protein [Desulfobacterales bacterium]|nr:hemerythrin family protein [Desulfobacterales bacterium]MCP4163614.1 hemerythrin family protein [Deltaproteobacteria bacterium]
MQLYDWDKNYSVDFEPIDTQHKMLLGMINKLLLNQLKEKKIILMLMEEVVLYAKFHFFSEENFMQIYNYNGFDFQKSEHAKLLNEIIINSSLYKDDKIKLEDFVKFLVNWFVSHTTATDKKLGKFLKESIGDKGKIL